jgi:hypothetical protein
MPLRASLNRSELDRGGHVQSTDARKLQRGRRISKPSTAPKNRSRSVHTGACFHTIGAERAASSRVPVIRIHSDRKWPERVVYNTNLPTIIPAHIANTDSLSAPTTVADVSAKGRKAFAQLQPSDAKQLPSSDSKKRGPTLQRKRKIAKRPAAPPTVLLAQRPQFGFFGRSIW